MVWREAWKRDVRRVVEVEVEWDLWGSEEEAEDGVSWRARWAKWAIWVGQECVSKRLRRWV